MTDKIPKRGELVVSLCGHDAGTVLAVISVEGDYVLLANGKERKLASPKRKKIKHVKRLNCNIDLGGVAVENDGALSKAVEKKLKENGGF